MTRWLNLWTMVGCQLTQLPFLLVEHVQFQKMIHLAASSSSIAIPNHCKVREQVKELAKESHAEVLAMILRNGKVSIAFAADCWTSPTNKGFLAITC